VRHPLAGAWEDREQRRKPGITVRGEELVLGDLDRAPAILRGDGALALELDQLAARIVAREQPVGVDEVSSRDVTEPSIAPPLRVESPRDCPTRSRR
jgi:hypothetical protein